MNQQILIGLHDILSSRFSVDELQTLCFRLSIDYNDLAGASKNAKAIELINYLNRRNDINALLEAGSRLRPDVDWPQPKGPVAPASHLPSDQITARWGSKRPDIETILETPQSSVLFLGTSLFGIVFNDIFHIQEWLGEDPERIVGLLLLNPHSPHAHGRSRTGVSRSSRNKIQQTVEEAYRENRQTRRYIPAVYDGPYRYSATAIDIGAEQPHTQSTIKLITSSHLRGISKGLSLFVEAARQPDLFEYYRGELLTTWKKALTNPSGHGISIVARWQPAGTDLKALQRQVQKLLEQLPGQLTDFQLFEPEQYHLTLSSLCRTQRNPAGAPLRLADEDPVARLPRHFPELVARALTTLTSVTGERLSITLNHLSLDEQGTLRLSSDETDTPASQSVNQFLSHIHNLVEEIQSNYPEEGWQELLPNGQGRFLPKDSSWRPHITIGRLFDYRQGLPVPMTGRQARLAIEPITITAHQVAVVHYAYRSLQRCIGELAMNLADQAAPDPVDIIRELYL